MTLQDSLCAVFIQDLEVTPDDALGEAAGISTPWGGDIAAAIIRRVAAFGKPSDDCVASEQGTDDRNAFRPWHSEFGSAHPRSAEGMAGDRRRTALRRRRERLIRSTPTFPIYAGMALGGSIGTVRRDWAGDQGRSARVRNAIQWLPRQVRVRPAKSTAATCHPRRPGGHIHSADVAEAPRPSRAINHRAFPMRILKCDLVYGFPSERAVRRIGTARHQRATPFMWRLSNDDGADRPRPKNSNSAVQNQDRIRFLNRSLRSRRRGTRLQESLRRLPTLSGRTIRALRR